MQTEAVKFTAAQKRRLLTALAYINTHRKEWKQEVWRCGTGMCLAGHVALTLNPARPVVPYKDLIEIEAVKKKARGTEGWNKLTDAERSWWQEIDLAGDHLIATKNDLPEEITARTYRGREHQTVTVRARAEALLGELPDAKAWIKHEHRHLFSGDNTYADLIKIAATALDMSQSDVKHEVAEIAKAQGWDRKPATA